MLPVSWLKNAGSMWTMGGAAWALAAGEEAKLVLLIVA